ncbi:hypothetical protein AVEN_100304-1, partial [Araneus ventricosus]
MEVGQADWRNGSWQEREDPEQENGETREIEQTDWIDEVKGEVQRKIDEVEEKVQTSEDVKRE